jgi:hypothetical protein
MKLLRLFGLTLSIFALMLPAFAQNFDNDFDFGNGIIITYPDDWDSNFDVDDNPHIFSEDSDIIFLFEDYDEDLSLEDYLEDLYERTLLDDSRDFDDDNIFIGELADFDEIASYTYNDDDEGDSFQRYLFVIPLEEEIVVLVSVIPRIEREIDEFLVILDILATLEYDTDSNTTVTWQNNVSVDYPNNWEATTSEDGLDFLANDELIMVFISQEIGNAREDNYANLIRQIYDEFLLDRSLDFDEDAFYFEELPNDPNALGYFYEENDDGDSYENILIAIQPSETILVVVLVYPKESSEFSEDNWDTIFEILATVSSE